MNTVLTILFFVVLYAVISRFLGVLVLNIAGLPGALIARGATQRTAPRYITGLVVSTIGQAYIYLAFMVYIINWTRTQVDPESYSKYLVWFFCALATVGAVQQMHMQASKERKENPSTSLNPQVQALFVTEVLSLLGFFAFVFFPGLTEPLWSWVNRVGFPI
jgi:hypothetical protein